MGQVLQIESLSDADHELNVAQRLAWHRADREARQRLDAELEQDVDFDALYLDRAQLDRLPATPQLIAGILPRSAYVVLRGRDQSLKSFAAVDMSCSLATGTPWHLRSVERARVLYIAGEGAYGFPQRIRAWETARSVTVEPAWLTVRAAALNLYRPGRAFEHLLEHVEAGRYGLVVVDTLRRVSGGADGNGSDMGAVVDSLDQIKQATANGTVMVVAHTDKSDSDTRGYSGIEDDADAVIHARRDLNQLELELTKMKDAADGTKVHLVAQPVSDSLALALATEADVRDESAESEQRLIATLRYTFPDGAFGTQLFEVADLPKSTYYRALSGLVQRGSIEKSGSRARPFYELSAKASPAGVPPPIPAGLMPVSPPEAGSDLRVSHESHSSPIPTPTSPAPLEGGVGRDSKPAGLTPAQAAILADQERAPAPALSSDEASER